MLRATSVDEQYQATVADDLRVLVVGAGIAGVTAAQLLRRGGRHPVLIERAAADSMAVGYMLALMPMVDDALDELGVRDRYRQASVALSRYQIHAHNGRPLRVDSLEPVFGAHGDYRGVARSALIEVLTADGCEVAFDSTVTELAENAGAVQVSVSAGGRPRRLEFDLVIIADGIHSATRELVLAGQPVEVVDTRWGGWVAWAPPDDDTDLVDEVWGADFFIGMYPVAGEVGVFLGGPRTETGAGVEEFVARARRRCSVIGPRLERALNAVAPDAYYWSLTDCRSPRWVTGRTVLLGDAAAGFLPTAGVGAGMAIESAWVLTRMLRDADRARLAQVLGDYERVQRPRVQTAQHNSRQLAKLMFRRGRLTAMLRDVALRFTSVERALRPIKQMLAERPTPPSREGGPAS